MYLLSSSTTKSIVSNCNKLNTILQVSTSHKTDVMGLDIADDMLSQKKLKLNKSLTKILSEK